MTKKPTLSIKKRAGAAIKPTLVLAFALALTLVCASCASEPDTTEHIDLTDPMSGEAIVNAAELKEFFLHGETDTAELAASISLDSGMLELTKARGAITVNGNGFTLSGNGDCVIRMEPGCELVLNDINLVGGASAVGALGDAKISGTDADISGVTHTLYIDGQLVLGENSKLDISSNVGNAINATGLDVGAGSTIKMSGGLSAVSLGTGGLTLQENVAFDAYTQDSYNALKSEGIVKMLDGAKLVVTNDGDYHGAEIEGLELSGIVTIEAKGGSQGVGLFLFELRDNMAAIGSCKPVPRFEVGRGSIQFFETAEEVQKFYDEQKAAEEAAAAEEGAADTGTEG